MSGPVTEASIRAILLRWRPRLGFDDRWTFEIRIYDGNAKWPKDKKGSLAFVEPAVGYFMATIHVNAPDFSRYHNTLEEVIVHELLHVACWPLSIVARHALGDAHEATWEIMMEQQIETLTRALLWKSKK